LLGECGERESCGQDQHDDEVVLHNISYRAGVPLNTLGWPDWLQTAQRSGTSNLGNGASSGQRQTAEIRECSASLL
jgi:hypothetical protein